LYFLFFFLFWPLCCLFFFLFWPLCCLFFDLRILIASLVSSNCSNLCSGHHFWFLIALVENQLMDILVISQINLPSGFWEEITDNQNAFLALAATLNFQKLPYTCNYN
jgi:hypothetical protein